MTDTAAILAELKALDEKLDEVHEQVKKTNGRVTDIEIARAVEAGIRIERAAQVENTRVVRAEDLAKEAWIRPGIVAIVCTLLGVVLATVLNVPS